MFFAFPLFFLVFILLFLSVEVATFVLVLTGLDRDTARFQAISLLTGSGYTTAEAELITRHPVRRKIAMFLMVTGNIALALLISILIRLLISEISVAELFSAVVALCLTYLLFHNRRLIFFLDRHLERQLLRQPYLRKRTVEELLKIDENFSIAEVQLSNEASPWIDKTLGEIRLRDQGVMVLSIRRTDGNIIRAPRGTDFLRRGDILLVYGRPRFIHRVIEQAT